jgi:hypothetical protein
MSQCHCFIQTTYYRGGRMFLEEDDLLWEEEDWDDDDWDDDDW